VKGELDGWLPGPELESAEEADATVAKLIDELSMRVGGRSRSQRAGCGRS
jgi:hypothetical protein